MKQGLPALLLAFLLLGCETEPQEEASKDPRMMHGDEPFIHRSQLLVPKPAMPFTLTDQEGNAFSLKDLEGKVVLVGFIYSHCPDICRAITATYLDIQDTFAERVGSDIGLILITTDPERDTPERMKEYTTKFGGRWTFLTGKEERLEEIYTAYRVTVNQKAESPRDQHSWMVCLVDRQGLVRIRYMGQDVPKEILTKDVRQLLEEKP